MLRSVAAHYAYVKQIGGPPGVETTIEPKHLMYFASAATYLAGTLIDKVARASRKHQYDRNATAFRFGQCPTALEVQMTPRAHRPALWAAPICDTGCSVPAHGCVVVESEEWRGQLKGGGCCVQTREVAARISQRFIRLPVDLDEEGGPTTVEG